MNNNELQRKKVLKQLILVIAVGGILSFITYNYLGLTQETALNIIVIIMIFTALIVKVLSRDFKMNQGSNNTPIKAAKSRKNK